LNNSEETIIKEAQNGNDASFEKLMKLYQDRAYAIAYGIMGNSHDAYDMVQDSFIKIYKNINKFNFKSKFNTWIYRIVKNTCIDELRKQKRKKTVSLNGIFNHNDEEVAFQYKDQSKSIEEIIEEKEVSKILKQEIEKLSYEQRSVLILYDIKGYDYKEISKIMEVNLGTVKSRLFRARNNLAKLLRNNGTF